MIPAQKIHGDSGSKEQEYLEGWKRARADLENTKKRMADAHAQHRTSTKRELVESLLSLADNFRSLIDHAPKEQDAWDEGVVHIARQFEQTLIGFGVALIADTGIKFNPMIHEAVAEVKGEQEPGTVTEIVQVGYMLGEIVLRPAKVKVTAQQSSPTTIGDPPKTDDKKD